MGFYVVKANVKDTATEVDIYSQQLDEALDSVTSAIKRLQNSDVFKGKTADSVKAYWGEAQKAAVDMMKTVAKQLRMQFVLYADGYDGIDGANKTRFDDGTLNDAAAWFERRSSRTAELNADFVRVVQSVSDVVGVSASGHAGSAIELVHRSGKVARDLQQRVGDYESQQRAKAVQFGNSLDSLERLLSGLGSYAGGGHYSAGGLAAEPWYVESMKSVRGMKQWQKQHLREYEVAEQKIVKTRHENGIVKVVCAFLGVAAGVSAILTTGGAAAPVVFALALAQITMSGSDLLEGAEDISADKSGHSFNLIRDTVFSGNQKLYNSAEGVIGTGVGLSTALRGTLVNIVKNNPPTFIASSRGTVTAMSASKVEPITHVYQAAKATGHSVWGSMAATATEYAVSDAFESAVTDKISELIKDKTDNSLSGQLAAIGAQQGVGSVLDNVSEKGKPLVQSGVEHVAGDVVWNGKLSVETRGKLLDAVDWYAEHFTAQPDALNDVRMPRQTTRSNNGRLSESDMSHDVHALR